MRWTLLIVVALLLAAAAQGALRPPARAQVSAREFSYSLSRQSIHAGPAVIQLVNYGEDAHDLRVQRVGAHHIAGTPVVQAGGQYNLVTKLAAGRYLLWCSIADHRARGMKATLLVRP